MRYRLPAPAPSGFVPHLHPLDPRPRVRPIHARILLPSPPGPVPLPPGPGELGWFVPFTAWGAHFGGRLTLSASGAAAGAALLTGLYGPEVPAIERGPVASLGGRGAPILYLGLNGGAQAEVAALRRTGVPLWAITPGPIQDVIERAERRHDLTTSVGRAAFAATVSSDFNVQLRLTELLAGTSDRSRDELAGLAVALAEAEAGRLPLSRLVISGHNNGVGPWGDDNGQISWSTLGALAALFPNAARAIEDLMISACWSGSEVAVTEYLAMFPNLATIWAYDGSAPGTNSGGIVHLVRWEGATRDQQDFIDRALAHQTRKGELVAVWSRLRGYDNGKPPVELAAITAMYQRTQADVAPYERGEREITDPQRGPVREHYANVQRLLGRADLEPGERRRLEGERDHLLRLLFYRRVAGFFAETHREVLSAAYRELGLVEPRFKALTRGQALAAIARLEAAIKTHPAPSESLRRAERLLVDGLRNLDQRVVPDHWT